ncbi:BREX system P-loop protein BrxC [Paraclostridium bifermentans]|uniref:BREX system P-loop protein BrxC n=1 Tax=Paraclostridium bifermentans TaxID=1490 RepID=UPI0022DEFABC|nr:BREX system P-loop protein BrxC [Paraclostridium bifermentans]
MILKDIYIKDIDRDIKGVIKVGQDDNQNVEQELDEYVLTEELNKHFDDFFENYKKGILGHTDKMGVWISGFFGSGKSHFLKILSYLLENKEVSGKKAIDYFENKIQDPILIADMQKAGETTTDVILFNIDSKSESNYKSSKDAILKVFNKVFDEMQGYCPTLPWVADLERQMVKDNVYDSFKQAFEEESGSTWEESREDIFYEEDAVVDALVKARGISEEAARNWFNKADENYTLSIEKFAKRVNEYIESKGNNHHVVFLVDEIGQYIGDDSGLMLNLQTVVEDIGIHCGGKCWILVTSQQDIDAITKGQVKGNDFSKIQGRFNTRLSLSSANVDEVIKKRILDKKEVGKEALEILFDQKSSILKNLITFTSNTAEMKTYQDSRDFVEVYPFIPYQFNLLQKVFEGVRLHGASGKHISEGERSLLGAFQESAKKYMNAELGTLIPFSVFYETIEAFLDGSIKSVISKAGKNTRLNEYDVEVLKVLFLLKYVKEINTNLENLSTLMISNIDDDKIETKKKIQESLNKLIRETLVQKNGEEYVFLTNDEQDINKEIQNIQVEISETINKVGEVIFGEIYKTNKFRYSPKKDFNFNKYIDETPYGLANNEIGIKIITPYNDTDELTQYDLRQLSTRENNMIVKLSNDTTFLEEIEESLKIEKYMRLNSGSRSNATIEAIKIRKGEEKNERRERANLILRENIKSAEIYVNGNLLEIKEKEPNDRINDGLRALVDVVYSKLSYIKKNISTSREIQDILAKENKVQLGFEETNEDANKLAIDEVLRYIERYSVGASVTVKTIMNNFLKSPFGWDEIDIQAIVAKLFKEQKIKLEYSGENLNINNKDVLNYITKRDYVEKTRVKVRKGVPAKQIKIVKDISKDTLFNTITKSDEDGVMEEFKATVTKKIHQIDLLLQEYKIARYPGKKILLEGKKLLEETLDYREPIEFFENVCELEENFYDFEEDSEDILKFFKEGNPQKKNFDTALEKLKHAKENNDYLDSEAKQIVESIQSIVEMDEPYNKIQELPIMIEKYNNKLLDLYEDEAENIRPILETYKNEVMIYLAQFDFVDEFKTIYLNKFSELLEKLNNAKQFNTILAMPQMAERTKNNCIAEINREVEIRKPKKEEDAPRQVEDSKPEKQKQTRMVSKTYMMPHQPVVSSVDDIETILRDMRTRLEKELNDNGEFKLI